MTIKVERIGAGRFVCIEVSGVPSLREAGWATERARELCGNDGVKGILLDAVEVEAGMSPGLTAELLENLMLALEHPVPVALVESRHWPQISREKVESRLIGLSGALTRFQNADRAMAWLEGRSETA